MASISKILTSISEILTSISEILTLISEITVSPVEVLAAFVSDVHADDSVIYLGIFYDEVKDEVLTSRCTGLRFAQQLTALSFELELKLLANIPKKRTESWWNFFNKFFKF